MENINNFYDYLKQDFNYQNKNADDFLEEIKIHIDFLNNIDKSKWQELSHFFNAIFRVKISKERNIKIRKLNKQTPSRDKKRDLTLLRQTIIFLENFSKIYEPYQEVLYKENSGYEIDFNVNKSSINNIAKKLQIISRELESERGNDYYFRDTQTYTQQVYKDKLIEIISQDTIKRLKITQAVEELSRELTTTFKTSCVPQLDEDDDSSKELPRF